MVLKTQKTEGGQKRQYVVALTASISIFIAGFHVGWPAPSLPKIISPEYPFEVTNNEASYIAIISFIGNIIGGISSTYILDAIGRKKSILLLTVPQIIAYICVSLSFYTKTLLYIARIMGGLTEGAIFTTYAIYISEISDPEIRGRLSALGTIFCVAGVLSINVMGFYLSITQTSLVLLIFPVLFFIAFFKMPETPYFLLMKKQQREAETVLKFLRNKSDVQKELFQLTLDVDRQMSESGLIKDLFLIKSNRRSFVLMIFARIFQQYSGCTAFSYYAQILLKEATPSIQPVFSSSAMLLAQLIMAAFSTIFIDKYGRKPLLVTSSMGCFIALTTQAIYFSIKDYTSLNVADLEWLPLVMMIFFTISFCVGLQSIINILVSEMFNATVKAKASCVINIVLALTAFSSTKLYQFSADNIGLAVPFYFFAIVTFCGVLFFIFLLPETKGKSLEQIQQELKGNFVLKE